MKVIFLCGSLENGKDGVGDYTRRLAGEVIRNGSYATIVALNDYFVSETKEEDQLSEELSIHVLRMPVALRWYKRIKIAKKLVDTFKPDWISLQYVPYAFHLKGLPFNFAKNISRINTDSKWHVMFHELWVGKEDGHPFRIKLLSSLQKFIIKQMLRRLNPTKIHTHLPIYKESIDSLKFQAYPLPLFANIKDYGRENIKKSNTIFRVAFFSQVEASPEVCTFLKELRDVIIADRKRLEILLLGGSEIKMSSFKQQILHLENENTKIVYAGFLTSAKLSEFIHSCHLGITPLLRHSLGKSGSVAAFLEHGIPVAAPVCDRDAPPFFFLELTKAIVVKPDIFSILNAFEEAKHAKNLISLSFIAKKFLSDIS